MKFRVRGDAFEYLSAAKHFSSYGDALSFTGNRTYGFPLFLYFVKRLTAPTEMYQWVRHVTYIMFPLHICASLLFYAAFLRPRCQATKLHRLTAPIVAAVLISYPALVTHTTTTLTDTFTVDLLLLAAAAYYSSLESAGLSASIRTGACGLLLGYAAMVRPSLWPALAVFVTTAVAVSMARKRTARSALPNAAVLIASTLIPILPAATNCTAAFGALCIRNPSFVRTATQDSLQLGLSSVRVFWSSHDRSPDTMPGLKDPFLVENYGSRCRADSLGSLVACLVSRPRALPVYIAKKTMALFDVPHVQSYAVDQTPPWFTRLQRLYEVTAFPGLAALLITAVFYLKRKGKGDVVWIGLPWFALTLTAVLTHSVFHIEGRYGFPVLPFALSSLIFGFAEARRWGRRARIVWLLSMTGAAVVFMWQIQTWDLQAERYLHPSSSMGAFADSCAG